MRDIAEVERLMVEAGITELEFRSASMQLSIRREIRTPRPQAALGDRPAAQGDIDKRGHLELRSSCIGNFRHRHATRSQPVVVEGTKVTAGEIMGFIRDGLLLYPVVAPQPGTVQKVALADEAPVGYGAVLFQIAVTESP